MLININDIKINPGRREAAPDDVQRLSESIAEVGMMNLITVDAEYTLVEGLHRLEAVKQLTEGTIKSVDEYTAEDAATVREGNYYQTGAFLVDAFSRSITTHWAVSRKPTNYVWSTIGKSCCPNRSRL